jgi:hypothetical protein
MSGIEKYRKLRRRKRRQRKLRNFKSRLKTTKDPEKKKYLVQKIKKIILFEPTDLSDKEIRRLKIDES